VDAYVFGSHDGELPISLVGTGDEGRRVRAIARIDSDGPDVVYALQVASADDARQLVDALGAAGTRPGTVLFPDAAAAATSLHPIPVPHPAYLPPGRWIAFVHVVGEGAEQAIETLLELLGEGRVAAVQLDDGSYLIEATSDDRDALVTALDSAIIDTLTEQVRGLASSDEFHRAS
jgi:hypothetical protein